MQTIAAAGAEPFIAFKVSGPCKYSALWSRLYHFFATERTSTWPTTTKRSNVEARAR